MDAIRLLEQLENRYDEVLSKLDDLLSKIDTVLVEYRPATSLPPSAESTRDRNATT